MPIVKKLRRPCRDCDKMFVPDGMYTRFCNKCLVRREELGKKKCAEGVRKYRLCNSKKVTKI